MMKITLKMFVALVFCMAAYTASAQNAIEYNDFQYDTNSGFTGFATSNPNSVPIGTLIKRTSNLPTDEAGAPGTSILGYTRPVNNIGHFTDIRVQKSVKVSGHTSGTNYSADVWVVTQAVDISSYSKMNVSFASQNQYNEGVLSDPFTVLIGLDYTDGTDPSTVSWTDVTADVISVNGTFGNDGSWSLASLNLDAYTGMTGSDKIALAFKFEMNDDGGAFDTATNRNGNWNLADVRYYSNPEDVDNGSFSALNTSFSGQTNVFNTPTASIDNANFSNNGAAKWNDILTTTTSVPRLADGVEVPINEGYLFEVSSSYNPILVTEMRYKLANGTDSKGAPGDSQWIVQASNDNSSWDTVSSVISPATNAADEETIALTTSQEYRYYRFVLNAAWTPSQLYTSLQQLDFTVDNSLLSTKNDLLKDSIMVYPNPSSNFLTIKMIDHSMKVKKVGLIDLSGKLIYSNKNTKPIDVQNFAAGVYVLKIQSQDGGELQKKVVIN